MARTHNTLTELFTDIADEIRAKKGTSETIIADNFPTEIANLPSGGGGNTFILETPTTSGYYIPHLSLNINEGTLHEYQFRAYGNYGYLRNVSISSNFTVIPRYFLYSQGNLESVTLPNTIIEIGTYAFFGCRNLLLTSLPSSVQYLSNYCFSNCSEITINEIPNGVNNVSANSFQGCTSIIEMTFNEGTSNIRNNAFDGCTSLKKLYCLKTTPPTLGTNVFRNCPLERIEVPAGSLNAYQTASGWSEFANIMVEI